MSIKVSAGILVYVYFDILLTIGNYTYSSSSIKLNFFFFFVLSLLIYSIFFLSRWVEIANDRDIFSRLV